jgi:DNA mismatch endonuclease, patch repair protein
MDKFSKTERSHIMALVRSRGNESTEVKLVSLLRRDGLAGWRRGLRLPGQPDFAFTKRRVAVFVDGCFWHGCPRCYRRPKSHRQYWDAKMSRNIRRDRTITRLLRRQGWRVVRIWEHELTCAPQRCVGRIQTALAKPVLHRVAKRSRAHGPEDLSELAMKAMCKAVKRVILEHRRMKLPLVLWRAGKVVHVPADQVPFPKYRRSQLQPVRVTTRKTATHLKEN